MTTSSRRGDHSARWRRARRLAASASAVAVALGAGAGLVALLAPPALAGPNLLVRLPRRHLRPYLIVPAERDAGL
ncbi:MAG: hypothetical protein ACRDWV_01790 [Acidimicrobiales bacterium]